MIGARPYRADLGRFLRVDPVEGGCANAYTYVHGDPVNSVDLDGRADCEKLWADIYKRVFQKQGVDGAKTRGLMERAGDLQANKHSMDQQTHIEQYDGLRDKIRKLWEEWKDGGCKPPPPRGHKVMNEARRYIFSTGQQWADKWVGATDSTASTPSADPAASPAFDWTALLMTGAAIALGMGGGNPLRLSYL